MSNNGRKILIGAVVAVILAVGLAVGAMYLSPSGSTTTPGISSSSSLSSTSTGQQSSSSSQSSSQSSSSSGVLGQTGSMNIYLTDAPPASPQFKYLLVNVSSVVLKYEGNVSTVAPQNQWVFNVSSKAGQNVNLTSLVNSSVLLGATKVPAGNVTGIILNITGARAFFSDGTSAQLKVVADGKLMIPINFTVGSNSTNNLTVDITPNSIHLSQGSTPVLTPVIHVTDVQTSQGSTITAHGSTSATNTTSTSTSTTVDSSTTITSSTTSQTSTTASSSSSTSSTTTTTTT